MIVIDIYPIIQFSARNWTSAFTKMSIRPFASDHCVVQFNTHWKWLKPSPTFRATVGEKKKDFFFAPHIRIQSLSLLQESVGLCSGRWVILRLLPVLFMCIFSLTLSSHFKADYSIDYSINPLVHKMSKLMTNASHMQHRPKVMSCLYLHLLYQRWNPWNKHQNWFLLKIFLAVSKMPK